MVAFQRKVLPSAVMVGAAMMEAMARKVSCKPPQNRSRI